MLKFIAFDFFYYTINKTFTFMILNDLPKIRQYMPLHLIVLNQTESYHRSHRLYTCRNKLTSCHHPNMLTSDKTSRQCFDCCWRQYEASLPDWLMNWQKPPASSAKQQRVSTIQPWHLFLSQEGPSLLHPPPAPFYLFIITFSQSCFSPGRAACF